MSNPSKLIFVHTKCGAAVVDVIFAGTDLYFDYHCQVDVVIAALKANKSAIAHVGELPRTLVDELMKELRAVARHYDWKLPACAYEAPVDADSPYHCGWQALRKPRFEASLTSTETGA